jgi:hypothetical protein
MTLETLDQLLEASAAALVGAIPDPPFEFRVGFADDYEQLLAGRADHATGDFDAVIDHALERGRLLIAAEAGAGKSSVAVRVLARAIQRRVATVRIDLRRWSPEVHDAWKAMRHSDTRRMALLLERLSDVSIRERRLRGLAENHGAIVVVDGLNEVPPSATRELLWVLDVFASRCPWAGAVVCDRLQRRPLPSAHWRLATVTRVRRPDGQDGPDNALLLDIAGQSDDGTYNEATILRAHLVAHADLGDQDLAALDATCLGLYRQYREGQGRFFEIDALADGVGGDVVERLLRSGELRREGERAYFRHHLFHDALAAGAVAGNPDMWSRDWLDALTFAANSYDAVALALELIDTAEAADAFVTAVYDWSLYGAAYAVSQGRRHGSVAVSFSTELALLAVLAERRWDPVAPSVQKVEDALRVAPTEPADALLAARDLDEVVALVSQHADEDARRTWLSLFAGKVPVDQLIDMLHHGPVPGWIASNALRRHPLDPTSRAAVLDALSSDDKTVRWRAAHTLGADASDEAVYALLGALDDEREWHWVRYGAVRALVELAAHDDIRREWVLKELQERLIVLAKDELVFRELESALQLRNPPTGWATAVAPLIEELFVKAATVAEQDHWRRVGRRISDSVQLARDGQLA